jgi:hypothetical protein
VPATLRARDRVGTVIAARLRTITRNVECNICGLVAFFAPPVRQTAFRARKIPAYPRAQCANAWHVACNQSVISNGNSRFSEVVVNARRNDMAQQGHNNPQQPDKQAPNRQPGSQQDPSRRAEPGREPYRQQPDQKDPEREMPKRASRPEEDEE